MNIRDLISYDPETGIITNKSLKSTRKVGEELGCVNTVGYKVIRIKKTLYLAHRLAWLYHYGQWPSGVIDHINMIRTDNRISNLRDVPKRVNQENRKCAQSNGSLGVLGVTFSKRRNHYVAQICAKGIHYYLGAFHSANDAHSAYVEAKRKLHDGCTI